jgi:hypothetical protein
MKFSTNKARVRVKRSIRKGRKNLEHLALQITTATMFVLGITVAAALIKNTNIIL